VRADRLVAILLLLQARGQVTATEVAEELEVSERTARRDLEALGMAGVPVYSRQGRNGGWQLAGGGRTDLSGLNAAEARALFLVAGSSATATPEVKAALRKLTRALPEAFREDAEAASSAVVVDPNGWGRQDHRPPPAHLDGVQRAVIEGQQVELDYVDRERSATTRVVHPLGLAAKGTSWYLVAGTEAGLRTFRLDRVRAVRPTGERVVKPEGFELGEAWRLIREEVDRRRATLWAQGYADAGIIGFLRSAFGNRLRIGPKAADGRVEIDVGGAHERAIAWEIAGFGGLVELVDPPGVRAELARIGAELSARYADPA
jgi:predicted DNA-binding transcriptional regulator YafY